MSAVLLIKILQYHEDHHHHHHHHSFPVQMHDYDDGAASRFEAHGLTL